MLVDSEDTVVKLSSVVISRVLVSGFVNTSEVVEPIPDVEAVIKNEKRIVEEKKVIYSL